MTTEQKSVTMADMEKLLDEKLAPVLTELKAVRMKTNQMYDALEKHGLPLPSRQNS